MKNLDKIIDSLINQMMYTQETGSNLGNNDNTTSCAAATALGKIAVQLINQEMKKNN